MQSPIIHPLVHDGIVHHPLGAGSYIFQKNLIQHITQYCTKPVITLQIGAQPNSSPHMGTLVTFAAAFALAKHIRDQDPPRNVRISLDLVDTAPSQQWKLDGIDYQRSQRCTGEMKQYLADFETVMEAFQSYSGIPWSIRSQAQFLSHPNAVTAVRQVIQHREEYGKSFSPETGCIAVRAACPHDGCGIAEKHGVSNTYEEDSIVFQCPSHGAYAVDIKSVDGVSQLEFNTPLRNILRTFVFHRDVESDWIHVTGSDYAGYYQEQLMWRHAVGTPPLVFYAPLIIDWSGAKLSKSLYVCPGSYEYLKREKADYLVSFERFQEQGKDLRIVYDEAEDWVKNPFKLFRSYSVEYMMRLFEERVVSTSNADTVVNGSK